MDSQTHRGQEPLLNPDGPDGPPVTATRINFSQTPLAEHYGPYFAMTLDNLLTPAECAAVLASAGTNWQTLSKGDSFRECEQVRPISEAWATALYERLVPHLPAEVKALRKGDALAAHIAGSAHLKANQGAKKTVWRLRGANEKLSFLRYRPGHHFKPHCDASYAPPGRDEKSFLTCQIYLSDMPEEQGRESSGGETRFWSSRVGLGKKNRDQEGGDGERRDEEFVDVKPKMGRALVFQQRMLWHSGQEVKRGEKFTVRLDLMYEHHFEKPPR
ncbi:hypothetical protein F4779DRAFT_585756 [Xylariaceae sp. FL0662B]|nr:hypothetical protein F4779DRAFT_585756 [Xylariaceae sp. FL0662B]